MKQKNVLEIDSSSTYFRNKTVMRVSDKYTE